MTSIVERERTLYATVGAAADSYVDHSPGARVVPAFLEMAGLGGLAGDPRLYTVLDAGCCSGKASLALRAAGFEGVQMCDLTGTMLVPEAEGLPFFEACLWKPLAAQAPYVFGRAWDYVFCCDVLEHVPPEYTMLTLATLLDASRRGLFLSISTVEDGFGVFAGEPLHKTVRPFTWWRDRLADLGELVECRDLMNAGLYLARKR